MAEALSVTRAVARRYLGDPIDLTERDRILTSHLKQKGCFSYDHHGYDTNYPVEMDELSMTPIGAGDTPVYVEADVVRQFTTDWVGYEIATMIDKKNRKMMKGPTALKDYYKETLPLHRRSFANNYANELFNDGSDGVNRINGFGTILSKDKFTTPTAATARVALPSVTSYHGQSLVLGAEVGSSWSNDLADANKLTMGSSTTHDWPLGRGTPSFDFASYLGVNYTSTKFGTDSNLWEDNCWRAINLMIRILVRLNGSRGRPTLILLATELMEGYEDYQEAKFRNVIPHEEGDDLGFPDTLKQKGVMIATDYTVPSSLGYALNANAIEIACLDAVLFDVVGPIEDQRTGHTLFRGESWQQMWLQPKFFGLLADWI